jgi:RNA polymerase sigma-70 factor (ECF subfamily)
MSDTDERLVSRLRARDTQAFREVVLRYQQKVLNLVYRLLGNREEARDIAQEVFVTVFKSIDSFRGESKFSTWLYRIAANHCKNRIKYLSRRDFHRATPLDDEADRLSGESGDGPALFLQATVERPDKMYEGMQIQGALRRALGELDEEHRTLVILRDVENLSYHEICEITKLPEGTVKSRLHRARLALKEKIDKYTK